MSEPKKYRIPPRRAFRQMGLGKLVDGYIKVVAGFRFKWWDPGGGVTPLIVNARVIRMRKSDPESLAR